MGKNEVILFIFWLWELLLFQELSFFYGAAVCRKESPYRTSVNSADYTEGGHLRRTDLHTRWWYWGASISTLFPFVSQLGKIWQPARHFFVSWIQSKGKVQEIYTPKNVITILELLDLWRYCGFITPPAAVVIFKFPPSQNLIILLENFVLQ
jgi:hypothetical protein